jgi:glucose 1-dehydrogenase
MRNLRGLRQKIQGDDALKAITVEPKVPGSARYEEFPEPEASEGSVLVEAVAAGVCGTDVEIVEGKYGWAPPGKTPGVGA